MEGSGENWPHYHQMDIDTKLEKAIDYAIYLEERVRELEKKQNNNDDDDNHNNNKTSGKASSSRGYINSNNNFYDDGGSSSSCDKGGEEEWHEVSLPEVKARFSENEVLITIHCEKQTGIMNKILPQLENLNLSVISTSVLPFGKNTLDITIVAQMGEEFNSSVSGIVESMRQAISK